MPTDTKTEQPGVCCKGSLILGAAAAIWLVGYGVANAAAGIDNDSKGSEQRPRIVARAEAQEYRPQGPNHDPLRARLERLSEQEMKSFYVRCSQAGIARHLDGGEAMACSVGYDVLLQKHFAGDFHRLLDWSRSGSAQELR
jgi:hypothetical protein